MDIQLPESLKKNDEILAPKTDEELRKEKKKQYYQLNKSKIQESQKKYREKNRDKYNAYMKQLTNKLFEDEEYKKKRLQQMKNVSLNHRKSNINVASA